MNHTPGPWQWRLNPETGSVMLIAPHSGTLHVMGFGRRGMNGAQPRVSVWDGQQAGEARGRRGGIMTDAFELGDAFYEHPDAKLIEAAPMVMGALRELQANPNDPRAHRRALDAIRIATQEV